MLNEIEIQRVNVSAKLDPVIRSQFGQFLTPAPIARFMASLFTQGPFTNCSIFDPGAGIGSLTTAFLDRVSSKELKYHQVEIVACEIDQNFNNYLNNTINAFSQYLNIESHIIIGDFIEYAVNRIQFGPKLNCTHIILNPPYKKINSKSKYRRLLRCAGIETVNLYSAFTALSLLLLIPGGQLVAIIPRSFCSGLYYRPFRELLLNNSSIRQIHLFNDRDKAFKDDEVLQENIIIFLERDRPQGKVIISSSTDGNFSDYATNEYPFNQIVLTDDSEHYIHIPTTPDHNILCSPRIQCKLTDLGIEVSTGPVVDFRLKKYISNLSESGTVPLLYPTHFIGLNVNWPKDSKKKPDSIFLNSETQKWLFPNGFYTAVRRFSSKEEKRRIVAGIVNPDSFPGIPSIGFENHLNIFHINKHGLSKSLAYGLAIFLNSTMVDNYFRRFNGHTQVNATDLRLMKYPSRDTLIALGEWAQTDLGITQSMIDEKMESIANE